jgi:hypothetical protein
MPVASDFIPENMFEKYSFRFIGVGLEMPAGKSNYSYE